MDFSHFWGVALKDKRNFRESEINGKYAEPMCLTPQEFFLGPNTLRHYKGQPR